jgi:triphosphatase
MGPGESVTRLSSRERQAARSPAAPWALPAEHDDARDSAAPVRVRLVQLPPNTLGAHACSVTLAVHAAAIAHNLGCVLASIDPEGPHQLRVALRRMRVALRIFEPVMRRKANTRLADAARELGAIVGELRDADVMLDEIIAPAASDRTDLVAALNAWRQEVRGRVRAKLLAIGAPAFVAELTRDAGTPAWLKQNRQSAGISADAIVARALEAFREKAATQALRLPHMHHQDLHRLRKDVKALRYGAELAVTSNALDPDIVRRLKRMQDALGYANDMAALEQFDPPLLGQREALQQLRAQLHVARTGIVADAIANAAAEWRDLLRVWPIKLALPS